MKSFTKLFFLLFASFFLGLTAFAQEGEEYNPYKNVTIASPNAASLGKYGDIPVNYHTGIPNISIPVYTIEEGPLRLPVSLSYHASGLKVMETASWVGAGWSLNAGGVITRSVRGVSDEKGVSRIDQVHGYFTNYGYENALFEDVEEKYLDFREFAVGNKDGNPDLYFFNFNGYVGKFYFQPNRTPVIIPQQNFKIEVIYPDEEESFEGFIITTPDGVRYHFGQGNAKEISKPMENDFYATYNSTEVVSAWYLTKVESSDRKHSISLSYEAENYSFYTISTFPAWNTGIADPPQDANSSTQNLIKNYIEGVRLAKISFSNGLVEFVPGSLREDLSGPFRELSSIKDNENSQARTLGAIQVTSHPEGEAFCKTYEFKYDYFFDDTSPLKGYMYFEENANSLGIKTDRKKLKLNEMVEKSCSGSVIKPAYVFEYYDGESVPRRLSYAKDHWGFYNGAHENEGLIPLLSYDGKEYPRNVGINRDAQWPAMRAGSLRKITYPTSGYTEFTYGANDAGIVDLYETYEKGNVLLSSSHYGSQPAQEDVGYLEAGSYYIEVSSSVEGGGYLEYGKVGESNTQYYVEQGKTKSGKFIQLSAGEYRVKAYASGGAQNVGVSGGIYSANAVEHRNPLLIGGLRIEKIVTHDGISVANDQSTIYEYNIDGISQGVLYSYPTYISLLRNEVNRMSGNSSASLPDNQGCVWSNFNQMFHAVSPSSIFPMNTTQGNHIGYKQVKVKQANGGYSVYQYYSSENLFKNKVSQRIVDITTCNANTPNYPPAPPKHEFKRGELKYEGHFNAGGFPLKEKKYDYLFSGNESAGASGLIVLRLEQYYFATLYEDKGGRKLKETIEEKHYNPLDPNAEPVVITKEVTFESKAHSNPTSVKTTYSANKEELVTYSYVGDVKIPGIEYDHNYNYDFSREVGISEYNYQTRFNNCTTQECKKEAFLQYIRDIKEARISHTNNTIKFRKDLRATLNTVYSDLAKPGLKPFLNLQNRNEINGIVERSKYINDQLTEAFYNSYEIFHNDTLQVYLGNLKSIKAEKLKSHTPFSVNNYDVSIDPAYEMEENYRYDLNGYLVEVLKRDGVYTSYIWDNRLKVPVLKGLGIRFDKLASANSDALNNIDYNSALRSHGNTRGALITTFTYDPIVGKTSQIDPNGITTFYDYDDLGRLELVKDQDGNILKKQEYHYQGQFE